MIFFTLIFNEITYKTYGKTTERWVQTKHNFPCCDSLSWLPHHRHVKCRGLKMCRVQWPTEPLNEGRKKNGGLKLNRTTGPDRLEQTQGINLRLEPQLLKHSRVDLDGRAHLYVEYIKS